MPTLIMMFWGQVRSRRCRTFIGAVFQLRARIASAGGDAQVVRAGSRHDRATTTACFALPF